MGSGCKLCDEGKKPTHCTDGWFHLISGGGSIPCHVQRFIGGAGGGGINSTAPSDGTTGPVWGGRAVFVIPGVKKQ